MDLYSEIILDHFKNPHNKGQLRKPSVRVNDTNPLCGDKIQMDFQIDEKGKIKKVVFISTGCAISQAAASLLTDELQGKNIKEVEKITNEEMFKLLNIEISPGRSKCALLPLVAAKKAVILSKKTSHG